MDYTPNLHDEIELHNRCGERIGCLGLAQAPYCYKCGDSGDSIETTTYVKKLTAE